VAHAAATSLTGPSEASSSSIKEETGEEIPLLDTGHLRPVWVETKLPDISSKDLIRDHYSAESTRSPTIIEQPFREVAWIIHRSVS